VQRKLSGHTRFCHLLASGLKILFPIAPFLPLFGIRIAKLIFRLQDDTPWSKINPKAVCATTFPHFL
jgi:hypothetical protein